MKWIKASEGLINDDSLLIGKAMSKIFKEFGIFQRNEDHEDHFSSIDAINHWVKDYTAQMEKELERLKPFEGLFNDLSRQDNKLRELEYESRDRANNLQQELAEATERIKELENHIKEIIKISGSSTRMEELSRLLKFVSNNSGELLNKKIPGS